MTELPKGESLGHASARELRREGFVKGIAVDVHGEGPVWIVAQDGVSDVAVGRAARLLRFFLTPVEGARFGSLAAKRAVARFMVENGALLMMPEGAHREGEEPDLPAQPLYEEETPVEGSIEYLEYDREHRDAGFEEIFHLVHDTGIGTYLRGALPEYQEELDREARLAIEDGRWGILIEPEVRYWLEELEEEDSLAQEYIASVIDTYYGLWGGFDERPGGMWGLYCAKTRAELTTADPKGLELIEAFLPRDLRGYEALVDPEFEGAFDLRFDPARPYSHHARYLVEVTLTGSRDSSLVGNALDNVLKGNRGDNHLDGGEGFDRVVLSGERLDYVLRSEDAGLAVVDREGGRDGSDLLVNVEALVFSDGEVEVSELLAGGGVVHSLCDLSQSFSFYMDGRFARQYLEGRGRDERNWMTLSGARLQNTNLLVLTGGEHQIPYSEASIAHVLEYVREGGGLVILSHGPGGDRPVPVAPLLAELGLELGVRAAGPARSTGALDGASVEFRGGPVLVASDPWESLVLDRDDRPLLTRRGFGAGRVLVASRGLFGSRPDASDPINAEWITPLLVEAASGKLVDPDRRQGRYRAELEREIGPLTLEYTEGTAPYADSIVEIYDRVRPHLVELTGVEPSPGMIKSLLVLPTGGGGFSSGHRIAIGAFWGDFPRKTYPMVELVAHEAGHSWVLPHAEPLWNEPIATYLGILVGRRLEMPEADATLERAIERARRLDPGLDSIDPLDPDAPRDLIWGKSYFVFEELERLHGPGALAKYFRTKRTVLPARHGRYTMDDCVEVWSAAIGKDLFGWFRSRGFSVDREATNLRLR